MSTNIDVNEINYGSQRLYNTYHSDLADLRIEKGSSNEKVILRDKSFKELESINSQNKEEVFKRVGENRISIDVFSNEYDQVANAEYAIKQLDKRFDLDKYDISLTNSELSQSNNNVSVQLHGGLNREQHTFYSISSNELRSDLNAELNEYHYEEEKSINNKLESINVLADTLDRDINTHIESSIQNKLIEHGSNDVFVEIRNNREETQNKLNEFENYFENNKSEIVQDNNFEDGYNSRTGSIESIDTLLNEYKLDNENEIKENGYYSLSNEARSELDKQEKLNDESVYAGMSIDEFPETKNAINRLDKELDNLTANNNIYQDFEVRTNDITKSFDVIGKLDNENFNVITVNNNNSIINNNVSSETINYSKEHDLSVAETQNVQLENNRNSIDFEDPKLLKTLDSKLNEANDFLNKVEENNKKNAVFVNTRLEYLENSLSITNPSLEKEANQITEKMSNASVQDKFQLYNHAKDHELLSETKTNLSNDDIKTELESRNITRSLENEFGKETMEQVRKGYLTSDIKKPDINSNLSKNEDLKDYMNTTNNVIKQTNNLSIQNYQESATKQLNTINDNQKAFDLKNNDLLRKYNSQQKEERQDEQQEEQSHDEKKTRNRGQQLY